MFLLFECTDPLKIHILPIAILELQVVILCGAWSEANTCEIRYHLESREDVCLLISCLNENTEKCFVIYIVSDPTSRPV